MPTSLDCISRGLRALRKERGLSQAELAEAASVSTKLVSAIEQGGRSPSLDTIDKLCRALKVTPAHLFQAGVSSPSVRARGIVDQAISMFEGLSDAQSAQMLAVMRGVHELIDAEPETSAEPRKGPRGSRLRKK
jgi:transcriptional regulator with XRE-family HTH domain